MQTYQGLPEPAIGLCRALRCASLLNADEASVSRCSSAAHVSDNAWQGLARLGMSYKGRWGAWLAVARRSKARPSTARRALQRPARLEKNNKASKGLPSLSMAERCFEMRSTHKYGDSALNKAWEGLAGPRTAPHCLTGLGTVLQGSSPTSMQHGTSMLRGA